ncbi:hypothetical protein [Vineibacter terrae]|uniref:hypothetical protein n=1 Tax=Vineibacter terrae TaxID=2586908 RepID=UPI0015B49790|nr:hypothetical protein [Vineibacter terrae]
MIGSRTACCAMYPWIAWAPDDADQLRAAILASIDRFKMDTPMMNEARRKLLARD